MEALYFVLASYSLVNAMTRILLADEVDSVLRLRRQVLCSFLQPYKRPSISLEQAHPRALLGARYSTFPTRECAFLLNECGDRITLYSVFHLLEYDILTFHSRPGQELLGMNQPCAD